MIVSAAFMSALPENLDKLVGINVFGSIFHAKELLLIFLKFSQNYSQNSWFKRFSNSLVSLKEKPMREKPTISSYI